MIDHNKINYAGLSEGVIYQVHHFRIVAAGNPLANTQVLDFGKSEGYGHETHIIDEKLIRQSGKAVISSSGQLYETMEEAINDSTAQVVALIMESNELYKKYVKS